MSIHLLLLFLTSYLRNEWLLHPFVLWPVTLLPFDSLCSSSLSLSVSCSLFNPAIYLFSRLALHKTMRAIPLSVEGERTLSTVLRGPVLPGNLCRSAQTGRGSAAGLSNKHSCWACETTDSRRAVFSVCLDFLTFSSFCLPLHDLTNLYFFLGLHWQGGLWWKDRAPEIYAVWVTRAPSNPHTCRQNTFISHSTMAVTVATNTQM